MLTCSSLIIAIKLSLESDFVNNNNQENKVKDSQTKKKFSIIWNWCINIPGMSKKSSERYIIQNRKYPHICFLTVGKEAN